jgi:hypothetical protein
VPLLEVPDPLFGRSFCLGNYCEVAEETGQEALLAELHRILIHQRNTKFSCMVQREDEQERRAGLQKAVDGKLENELAWVWHLRLSNCLGVVICHWDHRNVIQQCQNENQQRDTQLNQKQK